MLMEGDIAKGDLCWECRERLVKWFKRNCPDLQVYTWASEILHCHHEPKEKPKCWCETGYSIGLPFYYVDGKVVYISLRFCPECGKRLKCTT